MMSFTESLIRTIMYSFTASNNIKTFVTCFDSVELAMRSLPGHCQDSRHHLADTSRHNITLYSLPLSSMNLALLQGSADIVANGLYFVTFNQDATSLAVGTSTGYKLFTLNGHDRFDQTYEFTGRNCNTYLSVNIFQLNLCFF